ncbi:MAG TPA: carboxypeptidase regulatory-like domain-containing protein [Terracidiphilus sp.]|nr:carboxypeptidase regulatory-like domain-containing protein [Terracidiphilus sp.]
MRFFKSAATMTSLCICSLLLLAVTSPSHAFAQSMLTGGIAGTVMDPSGAAIPNATVTALNTENGSTTQVTSSASGAYRFSLLKPGPYTISAQASGFEKASTNVTVAIGQMASQDLRLNLGETSQTVEVTAAPQLLQTDTAQLSTTVNLQQLQNIPNPGSDITYEAQAKPGVVMNTGANSSSGTLGYGNFSAFGLPGTSNNFTVNGMEVNDPFLNLNNSGPSNLLLGLNDIQETDVVTNAYEVQYGTLAGVQLNSITRSGSDKFHGNLNYGWNGRAMNTNDWFNKSSSPVVPKPFSNFNQWAGAVGGPIRKHKAFFFANTEGISFITASQNEVFLPSRGYESSVVGANGNCSDSSSSLFAAGESSECAFYNKVFKLYNGTPNYANAAPVAANPGQLKLSAPSEFRLTEKLITGRVDFNLSSNDKAFAHFKYDHGIQPTYTDPINSAFDAQSDQPDYEGQFAETHTFGARAVNQFVMTGSWYSALFVNANPAKEMSTFPMELSWLDGFATDLNNIGIYWPEGRNATQYQIGDDFSDTMGRMTLKAGVQFKKDDLSDFDTGILTLPYVFTDAATFASGQSDFGLQNFTTSLDLPLALYTLGFYVEGDLKASSNFTLTPGIRVERNSNVACRKNCLSNFGGSFFNLDKTAPLNTSSAPYKQQIKYGLSNAFDSYQPFMIEPRLGFTWAPGSAARTVVRGGAGIFTDVFPGTIADTMLTNPPLTTSFVIAATGMPLNPSDPASVQSQAKGANVTFQSQFHTGGSFDSMSAANPNFSAPSFTSVQGKLHYPTYYEWNLQIQHEFTATQSIQIGYVGNRGFHEPNQNVGVNATAGAFGAPATPPAPSFGPITEVESEAASNYNGLLVSWLFQGHGLNTQLNYSWSHALDEISNGGILPFNAGSIYWQEDPYNLSRNYGNSDYDVRHNFSGTYLYQMPHFGRMQAVTGGWTVGGTIFWNSGNPFTPSVQVGDFGVGNYGNGSNVVAMSFAPNAPHHCGPSAATKGCFGAPAPSSSNPGSSVVPGFPDYLIGSDGSITPSSKATPFGAADRNQFWGPHFFNTDMSLQKGFHLAPLGEAGKLQIGASAFNLFNHPNFGLPNQTIDNGSQFGYSLYMEGPPTSIYGSGVGGDPSIRIIELTGKIVF